jgi:predicted trehalose synthase
MQLQPLHLSSKESPTSINLSEQIQSLQSENALLKSRLKLLQSQNADLVQQQQHQQHHAGERVMAVEQRLILEDFEGEGRPSIGELFFHLVLEEIFESLVV